MYLGDWTNRDDLNREFNDYNGTTDFVGEYEVLLAVYYLDGYEGNAFVLLRKNGRLYEVNGSHCSCYGLEGQWEPEETSVEALERRLNEGHLGNGYISKETFSTQLRSILEQEKNARSA